MSVCLYFAETFFAGNKMYDDNNNVIAEIVPHYINGKAIVVENVMDSYKFWSNGESVDGENNSYWSKYGFVFLVLPRYEQILGRNTIKTIDKDNGIIHETTYIKVSQHFDLQYICKTWEYSPSYDYTIEKNFLYDSFLNSNKVYEIIYYPFTLHKKSFKYKIEHFQSSGNIRDISSVAPDHSMHIYTNSYMIMYTQEVSKQTKNIMDFNVEDVVVENVT